MSSTDPKPFWGTGFLEGCGATHVTYRVRQPVWAQKLTDRLEALIKWIDRKTQTYEKMK